MDTKKIWQVRDRVASLKQKVEESRRLDKDLRDAENELAYLTGSMFLAVDNGSEVIVYGVSSEVKTKLRGMTASLGQGDVAHIRRFFTASSLTLFISAGGQISFKVEDEELEEVVTYHIRAFKTSDEAQSWAQQRRLANTSR